jgi:hypothetical protein
LLRKIGSEVDSDSDGVVDVLEIRFGTNPSSPDTDGDGLTDLFETGRGGDQHLATNADTDGDTIPDGSEDVDSDGLTALQEQAAGSDPLRADTDGDGISDAVEVAAGTNPAQPDSDSDGLPDGSEATAGTDPLDSDTDNDGILDGAEVRTSNVSGPDNVAVALTGTGDLGESVSVSSLAGNPDAPASPGQVGSTYLVSTKPNLIGGLQEAHVTLPYDGSITDPSNLRIFTQDPGSGLWLHGGSGD